MPNSYDQFRTVAEDCPWNNADEDIIGLCKATGYTCCKNNCAVYFLIIKEAKIFDVNEWKSD